MIFGFIFSLIVSVLFAVYAVPRKFSKQNVILYTMWMGIAYFFGTIVLITVIWGFGFEDPENMLSPWHLLTVLRGFIWVLGMAAYNLAIDKIGLTRFNQWKNIQGPVGSLLILLIIADMTSGIKVVFLFIGMTVMFCSALFFQIKTDAELGIQNVKDGLKVPQGITAGKNKILGILLALFSGVCFGFSAFFNSIVSRPSITGDRFTFAQLFYHSMSLIIFSVIVYLIIGNKPSEPSTVKQRFNDIIRINKKTWLPFISGAMFLCATLLTIYSYRMIPNAVAWSITQLNVFWTIIIGIFIFKEVNFKQYWLRLSIGVLMAAGACVILYFAI
ncbi:MAG: GRP family sugar transporter [Treponema sp.]|nr:GRP family sugar transporter [Treponema sp.]